MQGQIIKGIGGFYYVRVKGDPQIYECKARGRFRNQSLTPLVGDLVTFSMENGGFIQELLPRRNVLVRPAAANIDQLVIVVSASVPKPDWLLTDKLLISASLAGVDPLLVQNKCDEKDASIHREFLEDYGEAFSTLTVSSLTGDGLDLLKDRLRGRTSCFSGQSAVGKSSLLNALFPQLRLEVGTLSKKTERGKHTTRHAQLIPFEDGAVLDTPGFSLFEPEALNQAALNRAYPEFGDGPERCRFPECSHISEPDCGVKPLLAQGRLSQGRYARYCLLHAEFEQRRKHRYD